MTMSLSERAKSYGAWWPNTTLLESFDRAVRTTPHKTAVVAGNIRATYFELSQAANIVSRTLAADGLGKGDVISIQLPNWAEFVVLHIAATRLGAITNPLLPNYRGKELSYILDAARTKIAVIPQRYKNFDYPSLYNELHKALPNLNAIYAIDGAKSALVRCDALLRGGAQDPVAISHSGDDLSSLIFTSGTESTPKGVMHSHNTMMYGSFAMAQLLNLTDKDVVWIPSPVGHGTGFQWGVRQAISLGAKMVLQDTWNPEDALALIEAEKCSFVLSATPFVAALTDSPMCASHDLSSFRIFACAGAPIPSQLGERAEKTLGCKLIGMWGMTECFVASASAPEANEKKRWNTDGKAMPGAELAIFDESRSRQLEPGEVGELATRGPQVSLGYFNDTKRTADSFLPGGWLFSGDLATIDADGYIRLVGRKKDIVNRGGLKISTKEIEDLLLQHPSIAQIAIVPVSDEKLGEKACACIVLKPGSSISFDEMIGYLTKHDIATYKLPELMNLMGEFPMTPSGKIQKAFMRKDLEKGLVSAKRSPAQKYN
jgi:acyl-coenzyme A synthetase/AMP-(fatty) acid ligase